MKNVKNKIFLAVLLMISMGYSACTTAGKVANGVTSFFMPNISEDVKMGQQTDAEIKSKPKEFPLLPESGNEEVYRYVRGITSNPYKHKCSRPACKTRSRS